MTCVLDDLRGQDPSRRVEAGRPQCARYVLLEMRGDYSVGDARPSLLPRFFRVLLLSRSG